MQEAAAIRWMATSRGMRVIGTEEQEAGDWFYGDTLSIAGKPITVEEAAWELGRSPKEVAQAFKLLEEAGLIRRVKFKRSGRRRKNVEG